MGIYNYNLYDYNDDYLLDNYEMDLNNHLIAQQ